MTQTKIKPQTRLCELALKYGSDKCRFYTPFYHELFKNRRTQVRRVLELGIGYPELMSGPMADMGLEPGDYTTGASLFMWRDYFPNAEIYALDNRPEIFINRGVIHSYFVDEEDDDSFAIAKAQLPVELFDLIIEDGAHVEELQLRAALQLMPLLAENGIYIIEDIGPYWPKLQAALPYPSKVKLFGDAGVIVVRGPKI